ncbi:MAG: family Rossman fold protein, partial [Bryobacterales bacterium]|nr:family Rossman fold protein [Bryobacterales bacterium]
MGATKDPFQALRPDQSDGYCDFLLRFLDHAVKEEFVTPANLGLVPVARDAEEALLWIEQ